MTVIECPRCKSPVMSWSVRCPECGDGPNRRRKVAGWVAVILTVVTLGAALPWI